MDGYIQSPATCVTSAGCFEQRRDQGGRVTHGARSADGIAVGPQGLPARQVLVGKTLFWQAHHGYVDAPVASCDWARRRTL